MNFTLKQLRYVEAAGRLGSIAHAAKELSISQSSITAAIDALETSLDYDLFLRTPAKGIQSTPAGEQALVLIRNFLQQTRHFEADLKTLGGDTSGLVRIACYATAAPAFLPPILQNITENFPGMSVQVMEGNLKSIVDFLDEGKVDLVFTYTDGLQSNHQFLPLFQAPPYALINLDDPLSQQPSVSFAELAERPMVLLDLPRTRDYFTGLFERRGHRPSIAHTTRSAEIARALVAGGFGYTILNIRPPDYVEDKLRYRAVPISGLEHGQSFGIATLANTRPPKIVQAFIDSCQSLQKRGVFDSLTVWADEQANHQKIGQ
ncbi:LysR family transcriptional regulator [Aestuariivita boseongensis]|uniref:LysR family transcriptional regulator n=1 Tax=Aestuariivita boseongensis TaxID=1470562 RepID=UPI00155DBEBF|nr:LysR family transcriptional regulator [Aestuariivita boseongensis]